MTVLPRKRHVTDFPPALSLPPAPDYAPFHAGPFQLALGLQPLAERDWIEMDERFAVELAEKARLLHERSDEVFAALPEASAGAAELSELLTAHLLTYFPHVYRQQGNCLHNLATRQTWMLPQKHLHALDFAGRLVQEDLCLMQQAAPGEPYRLVGASVCFPTRWRMREKLGQPLTAVHDPVPGYAQQLGAKADKYFERLKADKPGWRINWSILDAPELFQPTGHGRTGRNPDITPANAGDRLWLRMERQTLRRLPRTRDVVFTIRVHVRPISQLAQQPKRAADLAAALRALPEPTRVYKSLPPFLDALLAWLDQAATAEEHTGVRGNDTHE